jgi:hypothetical protein
MRTHSKLVLVVGLLCAIPSCIADERADAPVDVDLQEASATTYLDVNDVGGPLPSSGLAANMFVSTSVFDAIKGFGADLREPGFDGNIKVRMSASVSNLDNWHIAGWRFDPCASSGELHGGKTSLTELAGFDATSEAAVKKGQALLAEPRCLTQLRLIAQPPRAKNRVGENPGDYAMHLVFTVDTGNANGVRDAIVKELQKLKQIASKAGFNTTGIPFGVHPALDAGDATYSKAFKTLLRTYLTPERLSAVAFSGLEASNSWVFFAGRVGESGTTWTPLPIPAFAGIDAGVARGATFQNFSRNTLKRPMGVYPRPPSSVVNIAKLHDENISTPDATKDAARLADHASLANAVNNPQQTNFFTTDCVSCHTATQRLVIEKAPLNLTHQYIPPIGVTAFVSGPVTQGARGPSAWNLRNLGYFEESPSISYRTAFETAESVDAINRFVIPMLRKPTVSKPFRVGKNPAGNCTDVKVYACFLKSAQSRAESVAEDCMRFCAPAPL